MIYFLFANILIVSFTTIGSLLILFLKKDSKYKDLFYSLSIGIMLSSVLYSLVFKSFEITNNIIFNALFFIFGALFMIVLNGVFSKNNKKNNIILSMFIHNIPEGMSVGLLYATLNFGTIGVSAFFSFVIGIALQNIADGFAISSIINEMGESKNKSILIGFISGLVEPISALFGFFMIDKINFILPYFLSLSGGICFFVIINDLMNELRINNKTSLFLMLGFIIVLLMEYMF